MWLEMLPSCLVTEVSSILTDESSARKSNIRMQGTGMNKKLSMGFDNV